jgi:hypothetical protein
MSGARSQAKLDAAFARGDIGADGQADSVSAAEKAKSEQQEAMLRGRTWLGREMLTWLLFRSNGTDVLAVLDDQPIQVTALGAMTLKSAFGEVSELKVKGNGAAYADVVRRALEAGLLVHALQLKLECGDAVFTLTLDAEFFDLKALALPKTSVDDEASKVEARLAQVYLCGQAIAAVMAKFAHVRAGPKWKAEVNAMREWMRA